MTEEPKETLGFLSDRPNQRLDWTTRGSSLADPTNPHCRRRSELKTLVHLIDDVIDPPFHLALPWTIASVPPLRTPKTWSNVSVPGVGRNAWKYVFKNLSFDFIRDTLISYQTMTLRARSEL